MTRGNSGSLINSHNLPDCLNIMLIHDVLPFRSVHVIYPFFMAINYFRPDKFAKTVNQFVFSAEGFINNSYC